MSCCKCCCNSCNDYEKAELEMKFSRQEGDFNNLIRHLLEITYKGYALQIKQDDSTSYKFKTHIITIYDVKNSEIVYEERLTGWCYSANQLTEILNKAYFAKKSN